jgi:hypothetical protein
MPLTAARAGSMLTSVRPKMAIVRPIERPATRAAIRPPTNTGVPGRFNTLRLTVASSGVGVGATGGIFSTAL